MQLISNTIKNKLCLAVKKEKDIRSLRTSVRRDLEKTDTRRKVSNYSKSLLENQQNAEYDFHLSIQLSLFKDKCFKSSV